MGEAIFITAGNFLIILTLQIKIIIYQRAKITNLQPRVGLGVWGIKYTVISTSPWDQQNDATMWKLIFQSKINWRKKKTGTEWNFWEFNKVSPELKKKNGASTKDETFWSEKNITWFCFLFSLCGSSVSQILTVF